MLSGIGFSGFIVNMSMGLIFTSAPLLLGYIIGKSVNETENKSVKPREDDLRKRNNRATIEFWKSWRIQ